MPRLRIGTRVPIVCAVLVTGAAAPVQAQDTGFNPGANDELRALAVQSDGKIVVGGLFTMLGGGTGTTASSRIGRLNGDGSIDTSAPPTMTTQPANQTARAGRLATFTAAASGTPAPSVQWQVSTNGGGSWNNVGGATSETDAFTATAADHGKWLRAVFTNSAGQVASNVASLTVRSVSGSDFNGAAATDLAVYGPSTGTWSIRNQGSVQFGGPGHVAVAGDYDGDGTTDIAVYRPSTGFWYVRNQLAVSFGGSGYVPVPGDYNGDGLMDLAVFRTATGTWYVRNQLAVQFGDSTDTPVPGDFNGDGTTDLAVYRPSTGTWYVRDQFVIHYGDAGDVPVVRIGRSQ